MFPFDEVMNVVMKQFTNLEKRYTFTYKFTCGYISVIDLLIIVSPSFANVKLKAKKLTYKCECGTYILTRHPFESIFAH
jgi:hypothetical protein